MPVPNDLSSEERAALFEDGGVQYNEPIEGAAPLTGDDGGAPAELAPVAPVAAAPELAPAPATGAVELALARDPATGRFQPMADPQPGGTPAAPGATPAAPEPSTPAATPPPGFVPHAALHEAREQAKAALRAQATMTARMNAILASRALPESPQMPDLAAEPEQFIRTLADRLEARELGDAAMRQVAERDQALQHDEAIFTQIQPDYPAASDFYVRSRIQELSVFNTPPQVQQILTNEVRSLAAQAWQAGRPAAEVIYQMAGMRGYTPQGAAPAPAAAPVIPARAAAAPVAPARVDPTAAVAAVRAGQEQSRSLNGGGATGVSTLNAEAILHMSDAEFEAYLRLGEKGANARFATIAGA